MFVVNFKVCKPVMLVCSSVNEESSKLGITNKIILRVGISFLMPIVVEIFLLPALFPSLSNTSKLFSPNSFRSPEIP